MTTDCLDLRIAEKPAFDVTVTDRHLRDAVLAAAIAIIFVFPALLGAVSLFG